MKDSRISKKSVQVMERQRNRANRDVLVDSYIEVVVHKGKREVGSIAEVNFVPEDTRKLAEFYVEEVYRKRQSRSQLLNYKVNFVAAACVEIACQKDGEPRTKKEISERSQLALTDYTKVVSKVTAILGVTLDPIKPEQLIPRFCRHLGNSF
jgi:transcription initiation factor TFIIIB Brf1 subunit/transcription initiation factor TFIIB